MAHDTQETEGVAVATLGESRDFPAFFSPASGFQVSYLCVCVCVCVCSVCVCDDKKIVSNGHASL